MHIIQSLFKSIATYLLNLFQKMPLGGLKQNILTEGISRAIQTEQKEKGPDLRHQHPKSHGLLHGTFTVHDQLDDRCKFGVFAQPQSFPIWVRFSNGSSPKERGVLNPDTDGDVRGMAIKLMDVAGSKLLSDEQHTQDFILANHPVFFLRDVQSYVDFGTLKSQGSNPDPELAQKLAPSFAMLAQINAKKVGNPLLIHYWSTTPYKLGDRSIKFSAKSRDPEVPPAAIPTSPNYLREAIATHFNHADEPVKFDFQVQFYIDDEKTPIENPMQEWNEMESVPITVATIAIPKQAFDFDERKRLDESLSFNPWHSLPAHEPLGSINLSRRKIYQAGAQHRREFMQERFREPQTYAKVHDDPK
jgi:hypothetical protein